MSTQGEPGISFEISVEQQDFRLLELPPALLALIVSRDPPKYVLILHVRDLEDGSPTDMSESLHLKSEESPNAYVDSKQPGSSAVLCTDDHTFQLREVQSSNSVFILQPFESYRADNGIPILSLSAIAQCTSTLELVPLDSAASSAMATQFLKRRLPPYKGPDTEVRLGQDTAVTGLVLGEYKDKDAILQNAPFSTDEFNETWKQLCAFQDLGRAWLPTSSALAMVWKSVLSAATVSGVNLENSFDLKSLAETVGSDGYPWTLVVAVVSRLVSDTDYLKDNCVNLSKDKTLQWVGHICLQRAGESGQSKGIPESKLLAQWYDLLPEDWRKHASIDILKANYSHSNPSKERIIFGDDNHDPTSSNNPTSGNTGGKANRKWHEKFKAGRK